MPLPLPIMIPFMMWQSAAIAAGFGTYFQYAKRRVSAMSNDEFNKSNPHDLVNAMYDELIVAMPSSFKKIESLTPIILDSMLKMLTDAAEWFSGVLGGTGPADALHHLQGLPGHIGHAGFGEDIETPPGVTPPTDLPELLHLTLSTISASNDLSLQSWINNINDYDNQTQNWLLQEQERRQGDAPTPTTPPQEESKLSAEFINSLSKSDLKASGNSRTRNFKGTFMKWICVRWCTHVTSIQKLTVRQFQGASWVDVPSESMSGNRTAAINRINEIKVKLGSSFVKEFSNGDFFLINDDF